MAAKKIAAMKLPSIIGLVLLLLTAFAIGIKQFTEPDLWWQLRTGEYILGHGVPRQDVFSYTFAGTSWVNVKWGYEVAIALWSRIAGPEMIVLLQSFINLVILWLTFKIYRIVRIRNTSSLPRVYALGFLVVGWLLLIGSAYRMTGRPEFTSHVLTLCYLLLLLRYRFKPGRFIFWLIPLQILWTNLHEAYGTGMVIVAVMTGAAWAEHLFFKKYSGVERKSIYPLTIAAILCMLAPAVHPSGVQMIWHPYEIFSQVGENKFTTELLGFDSLQYWKKEAFIGIAFFIIGLIAFFLSYSTTPKSTKKQKLPFYSRLFYGFGLGYFILFLLFFYLSLTAYRNIIFFILVSAPLIALVIHYVGLRSAKLARLYTPALLGIVIFGAAAYYLLVSNIYYKNWDQADSRYGLKIDENKNPVGASEFIKKNNISGNGFSDFLVSNYLLWKLQPDFKTFIDLRDLDIYPAGFFQNFGYLSFRPEAVMELDSQYHFTYAVLFRANFQPLHRYFANSPEWVPVFADPVAAVYLRNNEKNKLVIQKTMATPRENIFNSPPLVNESNAAKLISSLFNPGYKKDVPDKNTLNAIAADYFNSIVWFPEAKANARKAMRGKNQVQEAYSLLGNIYLQQAMQDSVPSRNAAYLDSAMKVFEEGLAKDKTDARCLAGLGSIYLSKNDLGSATAYLKKAVKSDPSFTDAWMMLADIQTIRLNSAEYGSEKIIEQRIEYLKRAERLDENNIMVKFYIGLAYGQLNDCDNARDYLTEAPGYPGMPQDEEQFGAEIKAKCGIQ
jgi:tetratricopeptide (TPR) repeat protein